MRRIPRCRRPCGLLRPRAWKVRRAPCARRLRAAGLTVRSGLALSPAAVLASAAAEHLAGHERVSATSGDRVSSQPPAAAANTRECAFLGTPNLWLPESSRVHGHSIECNERYLEPAVPASAVQERHRTFSVARQTFVQVQSVVVQEPQRRAESGTECYRVIAYQHV